MSVGSVRGTEVSKEGCWGGGLPYHGPLGGRSVWLSICSRDRVLLTGVVWGEHLARSSMSVCYLGGWVLLALG